MKFDISILFFVCSMGSYIYVAFISRSMNKKRYSGRIFVSSIILLSGLLLEYHEIQQTNKEIYLLFGLLPPLYLFYYFLLNQIFLRWIGKYPYSPFLDKVGERVKGNGYPKSRIVRKRDYVYALLLLNLPILTLVILDVIAF